MSVLDPGSSATGHGHESDDSRLGAIQVEIMTLGLNAHPMQDSFYNRRVILWMLPQQWHQVDFVFLAQAEKEFAFASDAYAVA